MSLFVYPRDDVDRVRVRRTSEGTTWLFTPLRCEIEPTHPRQAVDLLTPDEAAELFAAYGVASAEGIYEVAEQVDCRVCSVPLALRPEGAPWPCCPTHSAIAS